MASINQTFSRFYLNRINKLFSQLYSKLESTKEGRNSKDISKAQETFFRVLIVIIILVLISVFVGILGEEISLFYTSTSRLFLLLIIGFIAAFIILILEEYQGEKIVEDYKYAASLWNKSDGKSLIYKRLKVNDFFNNKHNRELRFGEVQRIKENVINGVSFRSDENLYKDRLLNLKFILYGPIIRDLEENFLLAKLFRAAIVFSVFVVGISILSIAYISQAKVAGILHWYVMRGISPTFDKKENSKDSGGVISKWQEENFKKLCVQAYQNIEEPKGVTRLKGELASLIKKSDLFPNINHELDVSTFHKNEMYREWIRKSVNL